MSLELEEYNTSCFEQGNSYINKSKLVLELYDNCMLLCDRWRERCMCWIWLVSKPRPSKSWANWLNWPSLARPHIECTAPGTTFT
jgi:hypothetical protein